MLYLNISVLSAGISLALIIGFALPVLQLKKNTDKNLKMKVNRTEKSGVLRL